MSYPGTNPSGEPQPENPYTYPDGGGDQAGPASAPPGSPAGQPPPASPPAPPPPAGPAYPPAAGPAYPPAAGPAYPPAAEPAYPPAGPVYSPGAAPVPSYSVDPVSGADYGGHGYEAPQQPTTTAQWQAAGGTPAPYSGPPMSAPPLSGPPLSGPPLTGPPPVGPVSAGQLPTAAMPIYGPPADQEASQAGRGFAVPILAVLTVLLLITVGIMTALYVGKSDQVRRAKQTVAARESTIAERDSKIDSLQKDLQKVKDDLDATKRDLSGSQNLTDELKKQKQVIRNCIELSARAAQARSAGNTAQADALDKERVPVCEEAIGYLSS
jgi:hypothetical protein